jgi:3-oxoacyl-[acyl-carrier protein] reductase
MDRDMSGRVAIVTGGGSGIGRATAVALARRGASIAVADLSVQAAARVVDEVAAEGSEAIACPVNVADGAQVRATVKAAIERFGQVDVLVNSAGLYRLGQITEVSEADWDLLLDVNLKGAFLFCKEVVPHMRDRHSGAIVSVSSVSGRTKAMLAGVHYCASKAGIIGLTMCLANQLAPEGIRVNAVAPSTIDTPMNAGLSGAEREALTQRVPLGRLGHAEEVAAAIVFLASDAASYITGDTINVNGGVFMV